jgi:MoaA/NifB/PqqE/SkfB family radical SAM enzyme
MQSRQGSRQNAAEIKMEFLFPKVLAWELTRKCPLACSHCRAVSVRSAEKIELDAEECLRVIDSLAGGGEKPPPMIIWTGGEPMTRPDLVELVRYAKSKGIRSVLAPCGALVNRERLTELKSAGIEACSFSIDGHVREVHDAFRGVDGAWDAVKGAIAVAREIGMPFQVNTVVRKAVFDRLDDIYALALSEGAVRLDLFFLVAVGRASTLAAEKLDDSQIAEVIRWAEGKRVKLTCCPQAGTCIGGRSFAFLSHSGELRTCGFFPVGCGNVRDYGCDFSATVKNARNPLGINGDCRRASGE